MKNEDRISEILSDNSGLKPETLDKISENCNILSAEQKNRIFDLINEKENGTLSSENNENTETLRVIEYRKRNSVVRMIAPVAACACIVAGITLLANKGEKINTSNDKQTTTVSESVKVSETSESSAEATTAVTSEEKPEVTEVVPVTVTADNDIKVPEKPEQTDRIKEYVSAVVTDAAAETSQTEQKTLSTENSKELNVKDDMADEGSSVVVEVKEDGTAVVLEDGIRYARMSYDPDRRYSKYSRYTEDEIEKINEDLKKIGHDAFEKYGNWQTSGTEEQQRDGVSYISFRDIDDPSGYLKDIWEIDLGNPKGRIYYDMHTLKVLTIEDLFGSEWKENNTAESDDDTSGSDELFGKITYFYDSDIRKVYIIFKNDLKGININVMRDNIVQDYVGAIDGSAK